MRFTLTTIGIVAAFMTACQSEPQNHSINQTDSSGPRFNDRAQGASRDGADSTASRGAPVAYVQGRPIRWGELRPLLAEAAGGEVLIEVILAKQVDQAVRKAELAISQEDLDREMDRLRTALADDPQQAQRLLNELRQRRGLGPQRFGMMLRRNAGLRKLVQPQVQISEEAIRRAYQLRYGPRFETRLIVTDTFARAGEVKRKLAAGASFVDMAIEYSVDQSGRQGGYIGEVSPVDATYPLAIRQQLEQLEPGQVSDPIALESGFAIVKLERKQPARGVQLEQVRESLAQRVRLQVEQMLMRQQARAMLERMDPTILDPAMKTSFDQQKRRANLVP